MRFPVPFATLLAIVALAFSIGIAAAQDQAQPPAPIAISHVTLINPATSSVEHDATVIIEGDQIATVLIGAMVKLPGNTRLIDGHGKFLIPGLWDMHVHSAFGDWFPGGREIILPLFVANGVTGVRDMGGDLPVLLDWRKQIAAGKIPGPRMIVAGPMLDAILPSGKLRFPSSIAVTTPDSARDAVDQLKSQGSDFIKVQSVISHDAYLAAAAEAHKQNLPFVGHVPDKIRITQAVSAGHKTMKPRRAASEASPAKNRNLSTGRATQNFCSAPPTRKNAPLCWRCSQTHTPGNAQRSPGSAAAHFSISAISPTIRLANTSPRTGAMSPGSASTTKLFPSCRKIRSHSGKNISRAT